MVSVLILHDDALPEHTLRDDLDAVGLAVLGSVSCRDLVREVMRHAPDVVVACLAQPDARFFEQAAALRLAVPTPLVVFTPEPDAERIDAAVAAGVDAYEVHGYGRHRLRAVVRLAQARCRRETELRTEREALADKLEERKLVDRAKGLLMRAGQMTEDGAFAALRAASQRSRRRVGEVSRQIIQSARDAELINRAGQLRMLSQRLVKLDLLCEHGIDPVGHAALMLQTAQRIADNLDHLRRTLSASTYGDLIERCAQAWAALEAALRRPAQPAAARLEAVDQGAQVLLEGAEQLTQVLEAAALDAPLRIVNLAGRQRMLSQRVAKLALLEHRQGAAPGQAAGGCGEFSAGLDQLEALPLRTP